MSKHLLPILKARHMFGDPLAVHDGLVLCRRERIPLPKWLAEGLSAAVISNLTGTKKGSRGRSNTEAGRAREHLKIFIRQRTVADARAWQAADPADPLRFTLLRSQRAMRMALADELCDYNSTLDDAYGIAREILGGTFAECKIETLRKAWMAEHVTGFAAPFAETAIALGLEEPLGKPLEVPQAAFDAINLSPEKALKDLNWTLG